MGVSESRDTLFEGGCKGSLYYLGCRRGTPILGNTHVLLEASRVDTQEAREGGERGRWPIVENLSNWRFIVLVNPFITVLITQS